MNEKIAYVTDTHLGEEFPVSVGVDTQKNWQRVLNDISARKIKHVIFGGDIGDRLANQSFFDTLKAYNMSISLGNHDDFDEVIQHYKNDIDPNRSALYYSQEHGAYNFIFLDSSKGIIEGEQFQWLQKELLTPKKILLFIHHPILGIPSEVDEKYPLLDRDRLKNELLKVSNTITLFSGHYHFEDLSIYENIHQYVTPACSFQVEKIPNEIKIDTSTFGYRIIDLTEDGIRTELVNF